MIIDSKNPSKTPLQGEAETDPTQQLVVAIKEEFPLRFQEPMVDVALQHLEVFSKHFSEEDMAVLTLKMSSNPKKLSDFVRFIFAVPLEGNQMDSFTIFCENVATSSDNIEDVIELLEDEVFHFVATSVLFNKVEATSHFLSLDKDSMINEFIIPFYKVSNRKVFDLEEETETAFEKGIKKTFGLNFSSNFVTFLEEPFWFIGDRFSELTTTDFVSIFEYVLEQQDEVLKTKNEFQAKGLKMGYSLHCLQQYPSGFPKGERSFPRAFIHRSDDEGNLTFDEMKHFIEGLPTELDRKVATALLESNETKDFTSGKTESEAFAEGKTTYNSSTRSAYDFDGVNALCRHLESPFLNDTFGEELFQIFRDYVSTLTYEELLGFKESFEDEVYNSLKGMPDWVGFVEYYFVKVLSEKAKVPKKILRHYRRVFTECEEALMNGDY
tara:strand:+ start:135 stop:1451 length:1317 start_codon:yes stop_codon:yes gene_type:complete